MILRCLETAPGERAVATEGRMEKRLQQINTMTETCPRCDKSYQRIGQHWAYNPDHRPIFSDKQKQIITGLMMGDGCLNNLEGTNPRLKVKMVSKQYLNYLDRQFGCLSSGIRFAVTAEENAKIKRESGHRPKAEQENYRDLYEWHSRTHPELEKFNWYESGKKIWPEKIDLTPTTLKHWYVGDGHYANSGSSDYISFAINNEVDNLEKVTEMFENSDLPIPNSYPIREYEEGHTRCDARFTVEDSKILWDYMGEALPDFRYKWP